MTKRSSLVMAVAALLLLGAVFSFTRPNSDKEQVLAESILEGLKQLHYRPLDVDDEFSQQLYDLYLERVDNGKRFLTQADVKQMAASRMQLDDQLQAGEYKFLDLSVFLLESGRQRAQQYYEEFVDAPFDFTKPETIELDGDKRDFPKDAAAQREDWRKYVKYEVMIRLHDKLQAQAKADADAELKAKSQAELETEAREEVREVYDRLFKRLMQEDREDHLSTYLNALTGVFDPHTSYFAPIEKENFDINMSGRLEGIGARLQTQDDITKVMSIVPGSPSWKQGDLAVNDIITKVRQDDEQEYVDVKGMRIDDVVQLIRGKKGTAVHLMVEAADGTKKEITIIRDVVILDEGYAKSAMLELDGVAGDVGYIRLPRFYANFAKAEGGRDSGADVKKELKKLNAAGAKSLVFDLRDNGGGSLKDVIEMTGLFIESGPIVQVNGSYFGKKVYDDTDRSVLFDGPVVVLVNSFSASASEILAAAMQDYDRAVIVGSPSTYGKGTVQRFFDLDRMVRGNDNIKPLGEVKVTTQKFYRINGGATQLKGVTPDIILPDNYTYLNVGEKEYEHAMEWTQIEPAKYSQDVYTVKGKKALAAKSAARIADHATFQKIDQNARRFQRQREATEYSLNLETYTTNEARRVEEAKAFEGLFDNPVEGLEATNLEADLSFINAEEGRKARNESFLNNLAKDIYIAEAVHIVKDMME